MLYGAGGHQHARVSPNGKHLTDHAQKEVERGLVPLAMQVLKLASNARKRP